jgi:hypothetical protein
MSAVFLAATTFTTFAFHDQAQAAPPACTFEPNGLSLVTV